MTEHQKPHPFDHHDDEPAESAAHADTWIEADALADVYEALAGFTSEWRERAPGYDGLLQAAKLWVHTIKQREEKRRASAEASCPKQ